MRRIRCFDRNSDDPSVGVDWRSAAIMTATLFLNFHFYQDYGLDLWGFGTLPVDASVLAVGVLLLTALFFIGPALAVRAAQRPVFFLIEKSTGAIPAFALRLCCVAFLLLWIAKLVAMPTLWAFERIPGRELSLIERGLIAALLLSFLFFTGLQSTRTGAKLALFNSKLGIAILVAAFIRVHDGWTAVPTGFASAGQYPAALNFCASLSELGYYAAPLGLFFADLAFRIPDRKQFSLTVLTGVALPLFVALSVTGVVGVATAASQLYQPSLNPTVAMTLWSHTAGSAMPARMLVAGITTFGAVRFGVRALAACGPAVPQGKLKLYVLVFLIVVIAALSLHPYATAFMSVYEMCAKCLVVTAAVLTADLVIGSKEVTARRRFDAVGVAALLGGVATALCLPQEYTWAQGQWWQPWLLPSYGMGFLICLIGRFAQRLSVFGRG